MRTWPRVLTLMSLALWACGGNGVNGLKNKPPIANAGHDLASVVDEAIRFDGSASSDPDGNIVAYDWTFGDGARASGKVAIHAYSAPGQYKVVLVVTDNDGATGQASITATITRNDAPPVALIAISPNPAQVGQTVGFDGSGSTDDGSLVAYAWDFGDGQTASSERTTHTYPDAGSYSVKLTVTDDAGLTGEASATVVVQAPPPPPPTPIFPATYDYQADSSTDSCYGWQADPLQFTDTDPNNPAATLTIQEGSGLLSATYVGTYSNATRAFTATYSAMGLGAQTLAGTFSTDFKTFTGTYTGGSCPSGYVVQVDGWRVSP